MKLKTRVFEIYDKRYKSIPELAQAMRISASEVYRVRDGKRRSIHEKFIVGVLKAFPGYKFDDLFYITEEDVQQGYQISKPGSITKKKPEIDLKSPMLTPRETAQLLGVHVNTVRRWANKGLLKAYRVSPRGDRRFRQKDITNFLTKARGGD